VSDVYKHRIGYSSKLRAMQHFVDKEYFIFNETNQGPIDFVAVHSDGDVKFIECKTLSRRSDGSKIHRILSIKQKNLNKNFIKNKINAKVEIVYVDPETNEVWA